VLRWDPYIERHDLTTWIENAKVYLYGMVDTYFEKKRAYKIISEVNGVVDIENNITVTTEEWPYKSDAALKTDVKERLVWNTKINTDSLTVSVDEGVVTLRGTLFDWDAFQAALKCALNGGAKGVVMDVSVLANQLNLQGKPRYFHYGHDYDLNRLYDPY